MSAYEVKLDSRGRLLLPKAIRNMFGDSVMIEHEPGEDWITVSSMEPKKIIASAWVEMTEEEIIDEAWLCGVFCHPVEKKDKYHNHVEAYGDKESVDAFFASLGASREDIKYE